MLSLDRLDSLELIIFDCDGVLIDSEVLAFQALAESLSSYGVGLTSQEAQLRYTGISEASEVADIESRYHISLAPDYFEKKNLIRKKLFDDQLKAIEGVEEFLHTLSIAKCVASSSSPERLEHSLKIVGLWDYFAPHIFSSVQVSKGKPAPDLFLLAAQRMGVAPKACLVLEDSLVGVRAARAAQMRCFGFIGASHCDLNHGQRLLNEGAEQVFSTMAAIEKTLKSGALTTACHVK